MPWQLTHGCFNMKIKSELIISIAHYHISIGQELHQLQIIGGDLEQERTSKTLLSIYNNIDFEYKELSKDDIFEIFSLIQKLIDYEKIKIPKVIDLDWQPRVYR